MSKVVFVDLDGTLLGHDQKVAESAQLACRRAVAQGHRLFMCTGRVLPEIYPWLWDLGFLGVIGGGGGFVQYQGEVVDDQRMDLPTVIAVSDWFADNGGSGVWQTPYALHPTGQFWEIFTLGNGPVAAPSWTPFREQITPYVKGGLPQSASKFLFNLPPSAQNLDLAKSELSDLVEVVDSSLTEATGLWGELTAKGINKAVGMERMVEFLGADVRDTVAVADSANDLELMGAVNFSVAMGNATPEIKEAADFVSTSLDEDGFYRAFEQAGLLG